MWNYSINRLLSIVPTLFFILIIAFFLQSLAPGDEVESILGLEGVNASYDRSQYLELYRGAASLLAKDRPDFYWSLKPSYIGDGVFDIVPEASRKRAIHLSRQTRSWDETMSYRHALMNALDLVERKKEEHRRLYNALITLEQKSHISDLTSQLKTVMQFAPEQGQDEDIYAILRSLNTQVEALQVRRGGLSMPVLRWNGLNNRFHFWMTHLLKERRSLRDGSSVTDKIFRALKWTLSLSLISLLLSAFLGLVIAYFQTRYHSSLADRLSSFFLYMFFAIPLFWFATLMVVFFTTDEYGSWTDLFPSIGIKYWMLNEPFLVQWWESSKQLVLPILCLTLKSLAFLTRQVKTSLMEAQSSHYFLVARAKGLSRSIALRSHALPNALLPFITIISGALPSALVGSIIIEVIFNIPGMGKLMMDSIAFADWPVTFSILILVGVVTVVSYLVADLVSVLYFPKMAKGLNKTQ